MNDEKITDQAKFANKQIKTKISFILGMILIILLAIVFTIIHVVNKPNSWLFVAIYIVFIIAGITGIVFASLSLKEERNVFNILGLLCNIAVSITFIAALIVLATLIPQL
ncbi:MAG: hypothetical protein ACTSV6_05235 [Candidatus Heimdallarchaeota archaeon]